jgi:hypothetical protein
MSREFQPIIRVEGRTFAPPQPVAVQSNNPKTENISQSTLKGATMSAEEVAKHAFETVTPHIPFSSVFWDDLAEDLKDPEFAAEYVKATAKIQKEQNNDES